MSMVSYVGQEQAARRGRKPNWSPEQIKTLVQGLADGCTLEEAAQPLAMSRKGGENVLRRLRQRFDLKTNTQVVAHYLRNGWID